MSFDRLAFQWIFHTCFRFDKSLAGLTELWIALPVGAQPLNTRFQAAFFRPAAEQKASHRFIEQLIDRATFDPAQAFKRIALFGVNSQSECDPSHIQTIIPIDG